LTPLQAGSLPVTQPTVEAAKEVLIAEEVLIFVSCGPEKPNLPGCTWKISTLVSWVNHLWNGIH